jgi:hypothetical protein|tara:strand:+ start:1199 stop:1405 length:207 start_codon:yes stop_codon:yes gene_type:complete
MGHAKGEYCPEPLCKICGKLLDPSKPHKLGDPGHTIAKILGAKNTAGNPLDPSDKTVANKFWQQSGLR